MFGQFRVLNFILLLTVLLGAVCDAMVLCTMWAHSKS